MRRNYTDIANGSKAGAALRAFDVLRAMRAYEKRHFQFLETLVDRDLVCEIGHHQSERKPLTMKQIFLLGLGSVPTVQRRLRRLRVLGAICPKRRRDDRRVVELRLCPHILNAFAKYGELLPASPRLLHAAH